MPLDSLRDGFVRMCFDPSLNVFSGKCRMLLEGQFGTPEVGCITPPDVAVKVTSVRDINCKFGAGSVLAEALKRAFECCGNNAVEIFALPRTDAVAAVKAAYTMTFTGPATDDGRADIFWVDGDYNVSVLITAGMTPTAIAAAVKAAYDAVIGFPFTSVAALGVITFTARNGGTVGNCFGAAIYNWHQRNNYAPVGVTFAFTQTVQGATDPVALDYSAVLGECCYCCIGMLYSNPAWQNGMINYIASAWACEKPQCFGQGYTYNIGTLGQILATDTNSAEVSRMAQCCSDPNPGWLKVAAYTALSCCSTVDNPELSVQGPNFGVLACINQPESCVQCFTFDEQEQLRDSGFVVTVPLVGGAGSLTSPVVTNDITNSRFDAEGRRNATFEDVSSRRLAADTADSFAKKLQEFNGVGLFTRNTTVRPGIKGTNPRLILGNLRAWAKDNVGILFSEFDNLDTDLTVLTDFEVAPKCQGVPGKMHVNMIYRPPVRIDEFQVNLQPRLLDNCR